MDTFFAIKDPRQAPLRKRDFLLFDRVGVPMFNSEVAFPVSKREAADLGWLLDKELVFGVQSEIMMSSSIIEPGIRRIEWLGAVSSACDFLNSLPPGLRIDRSEVDHLASFEDYGRSTGVRVLASIYEKQSQRRTVPLIDSAVLTRSLKIPDISRALTFLRSLPPDVRSLRLGDVPAAAKYLVDLWDLNPIELAIAHLETASEAETIISSNALDPVIEVVLQELPVPDDSATWEQILEFRMDDSVRGAWLRLRRWMRKISAETTNPIEIVEEFEDLRAEYVNYMHLHRLKQTTGTIETVLTVLGDALGNIASLKFGAAVKGLFALRERKIALLEVESSAPGHEVAYSVKVAEHFSPPSHDR